jgi:hypothetical protein
MTRLTQTFLMVWNTAAVAYQSQFANSGSCIKPSELPMSKMGGFLAHLESLHCCQGTLLPRNREALNPKFNEYF